jgi:hypothetical protein
MPAKEEPDILDCMECSKTTAAGLGLLQEQ